MYEEHIREKKGLEREAIRIFLKLHNERHAPRYRLLYQQERPDAVLENRQRGQMGLEITHLFYDAHEAMQLFGRASGKRREPGTIDTWLFELNERIHTKEEKFASYSNRYPVSLLIRNASQQFGLSDLLRSAGLVAKPRDRFERVWFLTRDGNDEWYLLDMKELPV